MTEYRNLGSTGLKVSPLTLGTMMFGAIGNPDHEDSIRIIHRALDSGINLVDTADVYSKGESEVIVGKALKGRRDEVVLATKVHGRLGEDLNQAGNSRRWIIREVEDSLRRLQTDWIDLYQVHRPEPDTDIDETLGALTDLVPAGRRLAVRQDQARRRPQHLQQGRAAAGTARSVVVRKRPQDPGGTGVDRTRRPGGPVPDPPGARLCAGAPGHHVRDHRAADT
jgi:aryl-alcohol dehydrogenase-like predicted oxidoreductase